MLNRGINGSALRVLAGGGVIVFAACGLTESDESRTSPSRTTAPPTTVAPPTTAPPVTYQVKRGDTLTSIARFFGVSSAAIVAANQLGDVDRLTEGQVLQIPPTPPPQVTVTPPEGIAGNELTFTVTSAKSGETVTFEIRGPGGFVFRGSPHTAPEDGSVTTTYDSSGDSKGTYTVVATGDRGTSVEGRYRLLG
jgi:LysM repeat protein